MDVRGILAVVIAPSMNSVRHGLSRAEMAVQAPSIGALVTDGGGLLSHPAIIAREYRVPAVVATGNATQLLRDGQRVTVDGSAGVVKLESL